MNGNLEKQRRIATLKKFGVASGVTGAAVMASQAHAFDPTAALSSNDASSNIDTVAVWVLGIAVTVFAAKKVIRFFGS